MDGCVADSASVWSGARVGVERIPFLFLGLDGPLCSTGDEVGFGADGGGVGTTAGVIVAGAGGGRMPLLCLGLPFRQTVCQRFVAVFWVVGVL